MAHSDVNITTREVADIARVDTSTVRRWADSGELPSVKTPGGHYRFDRSAILARFSPSASASNAGVEGVSLSAETAP